METIGLAIVVYAILSTHSDERIEFGRLVRGLICLAFMAATFVSAFI